jgi:hypothetical protein
MGDVRGKVFVMHLGIAAIVGVILALLWELPEREYGFFYDLTWGMFAGFFGVVVVLMVVMLIMAIAWAIMRMSKKSEDEDVLDTLSSDIDKMASNSMVSMIGEWIDQMKDSVPIAFVEWTFKVFFFWGITGGLIYGLGLDNGGVRIVVVLAAGLITGTAIAAVYSERIPTFIGGMGEGGISFIDRMFEMGRPLWDALELSNDEVWTVKTTLAWGIGGGLAAAGLSTGGLLTSIVLALVAIIGSVLGGLAGVGLKRSMVVPGEA